MANIWENPPEIITNLSEVQPSSDERRIGCSVKIREHTYNMVESTKPGSCVGCDFYINRRCDKDNPTPCVAYSRSDKKWVHFKRV